MRQALRSLSSLIRASIGAGASIILVRRFAVASMILVNHHLARTKRRRVMCCDLRFIATSFSTRRVRR